MTRESRSWEGKIESLTHEGLGVGTVLATEHGKLLRRPIFVPFSVPGDTLLIELKDQKRKYLFGEISTVRQASPQRVEPRCPHFTVCGGCDLQHVAYEEQLRQKSKQIAYLLQRKGVPYQGEIEVLPSEKRESYRWRSRIAVKFTEKGTQAGFRKHRSKEIVQVQQCFIVHENLLELILLLQQEAAGPEGIELEVTAVVRDKGKVGILVPLDDVPRERRQPIKESFERLYANHRSLVGNVLFGEDGKVRSYGQVQEHFTYTVDDLVFSFHPETFIQANIPSNTLLVNICVAFLCKDGPPGKVVDLYAGIGNLSLPIAKRATAVIAVEGNAASVLAGTANALRNGINNVTFVNSPVERYLKELHETPNAIVLDPPRTGLTSTVTHELLRIAPEHLVYVSCDPVSLADDPHTLAPKYRVEAITGIDMFPDVSHVETVVSLRRR